jgi:hypothetical protein
MVERAAADSRRNLAVPVDSVRAVGRRGVIQGAPPGVAGLIGFRSWGTRTLPVLDPGALGAGVATEAADLLYAVVLSSGAVLLTAGIRGVQGLVRVEDVPPDHGPLFLALGETRGRRRGEQIRVGDQALAPPTTQEGALVAVLDPAAIAALLGQSPLSV